ncbi:MAG: GspE/PulE/PilB domain-containing protein [Planctomycetota bacterium]
MSPDDMREINKKLRLGELLMRQKLINQEQLDTALAQQRRTVKKRLLGDILVDMGYITREDLTQKILRFGRIGEVLMATGLITTDQLQQALNLQLQSGGLLGEVLIELGYITKEDLMRITSKLGHFLVEAKIVRGSQLELALDEQRATATRKLLGEILIDMGALTESQLISAISRYCGIPFLKLEKMEISRRAINRIPAPVVQRLKIFPVNITGKILTVAMVNPLDYKGVSAIEKMTGMKVNRIMCTGDDFSVMVERFYGSGN